MAASAGTSSSAKSASRKSKARTAVVKADAVATSPKSSRGKRGELAPALPVCTCGRAKPAARKTKAAATAMPAKPSAPMKWAMAAGALDSDRVRNVRGEFDELALHKIDITLDFRHVDFIDSAGIGAVVALLAKQRTNGRFLRLSNVKGQPLQLVQMLCLNFLLDTAVAAGGSVPNALPTAHPNRF